MTPKLRFPEFKDQWHSKALGDLLSYEQPTKYIVDSDEYSDTHKTPVLTAGKTFVLGYTNEQVGVFSKEKLPVIIFDDFTTASQYVDFPFKVKSSAMKILHSKDSTNLKIAHELLRRISFDANDHKRYWIGTYQDFNVYIPDKIEQQKIADFLTAVDDKIITLDKKLDLLEQYKQGLMQKIFSRETHFMRNDKVDYPEWSKRNIGDIATIKTGNLNVQDASTEGQYIFFDRSESIKKYDEYSFDNEALIYAGEGSEFLPRYFKGKYGLHQRAYTIYNVIGVDIKYLYYFMLTQNNHFIKTAVGSTVKSLRMGSFESCLIPVPTLEEQQKIADFLTSIDDKIIVTQNQLTQTKQFKKALLQGMFV